VRRTEAVLFVIAALVASCGGGPPSTQPSTHPPAQPEPPPEPQPRAALPAELVRYGFGAAHDPVRVKLVHTYGDFTGKFRDARTGAVVEQGLRWEFADPAPFWACFEGATTKSLTEGALPGAKAVLTVEAGPRTLWVHSYRGWASFEVPGPGGDASRAPTAGDWRFSPEATDRVVELLNRTTPVK
jgi:hypothetical protein